MSYDIHLYMNVDAGGPEPFTVCPAEVGNYTSNVAPMWTDALGHSLSELKERNAGDSLAVLQKAVAALEADPAKYEAMNPKNGWGDYEGALSYLRQLRDACAAYPKATIHIGC